MSINNGARAFQAFAQFAMVAALALAGASKANAQDGISKTAITLGQSVAMTGPAATLALPFAQGARLYFERVNAEGGVQGRKIELITLDDAGNAAAALVNTQKLLEQKVFALFGYYGSPQVSAVNPTLKGTDILLFGAMAGADELRGTRYPNVYSIRPGYAEEAAAIARHAETLGMRKLVILHAEDSESLAALEGAEPTLGGLGVNLLLKAPLRDTAKAVAARPQSVLIISEPTGAAKAIRDLRGKGYNGPIYGFSNTGEGLLAAQLGPVGAGVVLVRVVPKSDSGRSPLVRQLQADAAAAKLGKPNVYMLEGYIAAWTFSEALRNAGKEPTRARLRNALDTTLHELNLGGFRVNFDGDRVGSKLLELSLIDSTGRLRE
jgi:ABC-type branched-subunit amino acid transport system substrate-binding protein